MYLPKSKYRSFQTPGTEYEDDMGQVYKGPAFETYKGEFYAGETPQTVIKRIYPIEQEPEGQQENLLRNEFPQPTPLDYQRGYMTRYIVVDSRNNQFYEVGEKTYKRVSDILFYKRFTILWKIKGVLEDLRIGEYTLPGTATENLKTLKELENQIPEISRFFDPRQFVI